MVTKDKVMALRKDAFAHLTLAGQIADREAAWREIERYFELIDEAEDLRTGRKDSDGND